MSTKNVRATVTLSSDLLAALTHRTPGYAQRSRTELADAFLTLDLGQRQLGLVRRFQSDGVPPEEWRGHILAVAVPMVLSRRGLRGIVEDSAVLRLAAGACDGYESVWDEYAYFARLTGAAEEAKRAFERRVVQLGWRAERLSFCAAGGALIDSVSVDGDGRKATIAGVGTIRSDTSDDDLGRIEDALERRAEEHAGMVLTGLGEYLKGLRAGLRS